MVSRIQSLGSCLIVLTLLIFAGSAAAQDISPRCEAAMDRAAGDYSRCLLRADASYARHENATKLENGQARCETRFDRSATRAINRHGADECASAALVAAMEDRTVSCAEGVATEAGGQAAASLLYVQNADGGTLTESTLTLTGVSPQTGWFTDRPYRDAGRMTTAEFVALFSAEGTDSFATDPPNADFTCEVGGEAKNVAVVLRDPVLAEGNLTYSVTLVEPASQDTLLDSISCDGDAHLFVHSQTAAATASCTPSYNCFVGGACSAFPLGETEGNLCEADTAASTACDGPPGTPQWTGPSPPGWQVGDARTAVSDSLTCQIMCRKMAAMVTMMPRMVAGMQSMMTDMFAGMRQMMGCAVALPSQACDRIEAFQDEMMAGMNEHMNVMVNVMKPGGAMFESMLVNKMKCPSEVPGTSPVENCRAIADSMEDMTSGMLAKMTTMIQLMRGSMMTQMIDTLDCDGPDDPAPVCRGMVSMMDSMSAMMEQMLPRMTQMMNGPMIQNMLSMMGCGESSGGMPMMSCQSPSSSPMVPCGVSSGMPMMSCGGESADGPQPALKSPISPL